MGFRKELATTCHDIDQVDLGFALSLESLSGALQAVSTNTRRWWIAATPCEAVERGHVRVGYEDQDRSDLLNRVYFQLPVLSNSLSRAGTNRIIILLDASCCILDQPGRYIDEDGQIKHDVLEDFVSFFVPLKNALMQRMQADG